MTAISASPAATQTSAAPALEARGVTLAMRCLHQRWATKNVRGSRCLRSRVARTPLGRKIGNSEFYGRYLRLRPIKLTISS